MDSVTTLSCASIPSPVSSNPARQMAFSRGHWKYSRPSASRTRLKMRHVICGSSHSGIRQTTKTKLSSGRQSSRKFLRPRDSATKPPSTSDALSALWKQIYCDIRKGGFCVIRDWSMCELMKSLTRNSGRSHYQYTARGESRADQASFRC